jgi:hypothetical protein
MDLRSRQRIRPRVYAFRDLLEAAEIVAPPVRVLVAIVATQS